MNKKKPYFPYCCNKYMDEKSFLNELVYIVFILLIVIALLFIILVK